MRYSCKFVGRAFDVTNSRPCWVPSALMVVAAVSVLAPPAWSQVICGGDTPTHSGGFYANFIQGQGMTYAIPIPQASGAQSQGPR
jgi:hypothetical protein